MNGALLGEIEGSVLWDDRFFSSEKKIWLKINSPRCSSVAKPLTVYITLCEHYLIPSSQLKGRGNRWYHPLFTDSETWKLTCPETAQEALSQQSWSPTQVLWFLSPAHLHADPTIADTTAGELLQTFVKSNLKERQLLQSIRLSFPFLFLSYLSCLLKTDTMPTKF